MLSFIFGRDFNYLFHLIPLISVAYLFPIRLMAEPDEPDHSKLTLVIGDHCLVNTDTDSGSSWHLAQVL